MRDDPEPEITPHLLLQGYASGIFPMAEGALDDEVFWVDPRQRGIIPLDGFHVSRSLARALRKADYRITVDQDFATVVQNCANRPETWINDRIFDLYCAVHRMGRAHSVEVWRGDEMIGGIYGVALGAAFFGESMFSAATNGSKIALSFLVHRLRDGGFELFDTQFVTRHLASMGGIEIERTAYHDALAQALRKSADFTAPQTPDAQTLIATFRG